MRFPFVPKPHQLRTRELTPKRLSNRLNWRLTGLFVLASVLTAAIVHVVSVGVTAMYLLQSKSTLTELEQQMDMHEAEAAVMFDGPKPDQLGLTRMIYQLLLPEDVTTGLQFRPLWVTVGTFQAVITYPSGEVITAGPDSKSFPIGSRIDDRISPAELRLLNRARAGIREATVVGGRIIVVAPIKNRGVIKGLAFGRSDVLNKGWGTWGPILGEIWQSLFITMVVTLFIGGVVGSIFSRRMTRRLMNISLAADRWASGDLRTLAPEKPADELGLLATRLNKMAAELQQLIRLRNEVAVLEERQRITRDLHDTVKQEAFATSMMVGSAQQYLAAEDRVNLEQALSEAFDLSRRMQTNLSAILAEMRSTQPTLSLPDRLRSIAKEWDGRAGFDVEIQLDVDRIAMAQTSADHLVRITEEALTNAIKHSAGTRVGISLTTSDNKGTLVIEDDGKGFGPAAKTRGLGLSTMRERAEMLPGGRFGIDSKPGHGTRLAIQFELESEQKVISE